MGIVKNPWDDVPIEVLIEYERKKRERQKDHREQLRIPVYSPADYYKDDSFNKEELEEEEHKIVIDFI
tara:strand:+ start:529 stop:732 length:204 start_codon:yes stop_codon:yes gene_type:complete